MIDIVVVSCVRETDVDRSTKVMKADGTHDVDLTKNLDVKCPDITMHCEASMCDSKATDVIVMVSRLDNNTLTTAPNTD